MAFNSGNVGGNQLRLNHNMGPDGLELNGLDPNSPVGIQKLIKELEKLIQGQQQGVPQQAGGGGAPQSTGGANQAGGSGSNDPMFSLEELLKELRERAQQNQQEVANALRQSPQVANALQAGLTGGQLEIGASGGLGGGGGGVGAFA